jgi:hypothetical protein
MPKPPLPEQPQPDDQALEESFYEPPEELGDEQPARGPEGEDDSSVAHPRTAALKIAALVGVVLVIGAGLLVYRARAQRQAIRKAMSQAEELMRLDTAAGYLGAADLLKPIAERDPLQAASARAFALAMLATDYRDAQAEAQAEALLVEPGRADEIPPHASLAQAALALRRNVLGDATSAASAAGGTPWAAALQARIALRAGNTTVALESAEQAAADPGFPAGLAIQGDLLRRARRNYPAARQAYEAALSASPTHPRAAYGLAKLALSNHAPHRQATEALQRIADDRATPAAERGRARLHLAALLLRAGDRAGGDAALDEAGLEPPDRTWAGRAAAAEAANRGPFRAVTGAPAALRSASDDDPADLRPLLPEPPRVQPPPPPAKTSRAQATRAKATSKAPSKRTAPAKRKAARQRK